MTTNSPTSLLDFIRRRVGVGELVCRRVDWLPLFSASIRLILVKFGDCWKYTEPKRVSQIFYFFLLSRDLASISAPFSISDTLKVSVNLPPAIPQDKSDAFVLGDNFVIQMSIPT